MGNYRYRTIDSSRLDGFGQIVADSPNVLSPVIRECYDFVSGPRERGYKIVVGENGLQASIRLADQTHYEGCTVQRICIAWAFRKKIEQSAIINSVRGNRMSG